MADIKISAGADPGPLLGTDKIPMARAPSTTSFAATMNQVVAFAGAPTFNNVGRNLLHNALFNVAQRGAGPFTANGFTLDRWTIGFGGTGATYTQNQVAAADSDRASIGDEAARFILQNAIVGGSDAAAFTVLGHHIERVRPLGGKTVTLSFWATQTAGNPSRIGACVTQVFGTGGSPSATVTSVGQSAALPGTAGTWQRYVFTFALPSTAGKTLGTSGDDYTGLQIWLSAGANSATASGGVGIQSGQIWLWGVQLEVGSVATPLDYGGSSQQQLAQCQRFYSTGTIRFISYQTGGNISVYMQTLSNPMRAVPTFTPTYTTQTNCAGGASSWDDKAVQIVATATTTGTFTLAGTFTASADL